MLKQKDNQKDLTPWPEEENLFFFSRWKNNHKMMQFAREMLEA